MGKDHTQMKRERLFLQYGKKKNPQEYNDIKSYETIIVWYKRVRMAYCDCD